MASYMGRRTQAAPAPQAEIFPHSFIGQYTETITAGNSGYIKQASVVGATSPVSDEWILATKSLFTMFLFTTGPRGLSLIIEVSPNESTTFFAWKPPILLARNVPNSIEKMEIPASKVKFQLVNASTTADAITNAWLKIQGV